MIRPTKFDEIIGQDKAKMACQIMIQSAKKRKDALPHILFSGPAGTGKTTFATVVANEFGTKLHLLNGGGIKNLNTLLKTVTMINPHDIVFIDEIHRLPMSVCESMYTVVEDFRYDHSDGDKIYNVDVPKFTLIGATTLLGHIPKPLRARFKHIQEFEDYSLDELSSLVHRIASKYSFKLSDKVAETIAKTCKGNPRQIVSRTEWIRDYMVAKSAKTMSSKQVKEVIALQGVGPDGLDQIDRRYIHTLEELGTASLATLSARLDVDKKTLTEEVEPYLMKSGYVTISKKGRELCKN